MNNDIKPSQKTTSTNMCQSKASIEYLWAD